jgi:hypothetical protein
MNESWLWYAIYLGGSRTRYDRQLAPEVSQANFGYIKAINSDPPRGGFNEAEEGQRQSTLARTGTT